MVVDWLQRQGEDPWAVKLQTDPALKTRAEEVASKRIIASRIAYLEGEVAGCEKAVARLHEKIVYLEGCKQGAEPLLEIGRFVRNMPIGTHIIRYRESFAIRGHLLHTGSTIREAIRAYHGKARE